MATLVAGVDVEKLEESGRVWKWKEAGLWGALPRREEPGLLKGKDERNGVGGTRVSVPGCKEPAGSGGSEVGDWSLGLLDPRWLGPPLPAALTALKPGDRGGHEARGLHGPPYSFRGPSPTSPEVPSPHPGEFLCLLPYLLPARLPTSFPNLFGNKASVHSQGLAGQGGVGWGFCHLERAGVRGLPPQSHLRDHATDLAGLAQLNLERLRGSRREGPEREVKAGGGAGVGGQVRH